MVFWGENVIGLLFQRQQHSLKKMETKFHLHATSMENKKVFFSCFYNLEPILLIFFCLFQLFDNAVAQNHHNPTTFARPGTPPLGNNFVKMLNVWSENLLMWSMMLFIRFVWSDLQNHISLFINYNEIDSLIHLLL